MTKSLLPLILLHVLIFAFKIHVNQVLRLEEQKSKDETKQKDFSVCRSFVSLFLPSMFSFRMRMIFPQVVFFCNDLQQLCCFLKICLSYGHNSSDVLSLLLGSPRVSGQSVITSWSISQPPADTVVSVHFKSFSATPREKILCLVCMSHCLVQKKADCEEPHPCCKLIVRTLFSEHIY